MQADDSRRTGRAGGRQGGSWLRSPQLICTRPPRLLSDDRSAADGNSSPISSPITKKPLTLQSSLAVSTVLYFSLHELFL